MQDMGLLVILFFFGLAGGLIGRMKGSSFFMWFMISGLIPFIGLMAAVCYRWDNRELRRGARVPRRGDRAGVAGAPAGRLSVPGAP